MAASRPNSQISLPLLVVRADRIGDVILSTPVLEVLRRHYPSARITILVREAVAPLLRGLTSVDEVLVYDPEGRHAGFRGFRLLVSEFRERKFRIAVLLQAPFKVAAAAFFAGIRHRVGPLSKLYSFLFYNRGIRQARSEVEMHEADYNLQLLRRLGIRVGTGSVASRVVIPPASRETAATFFDSLTAPAPEGAARWVAVHPGMGGSALNWPEEQYASLVAILLRDGNRVVLTGGSSEAGLVHRIRERALREAQGQRDCLHEYVSAPGSAVTDLGAVFERVDAVVAPSTGPLHLAVALGKPVLSFYPPIRVQSAIRWGPYVLDEKKAAVLVPEVFCGEDFRCRGSLCHHFPCMSTLTPRQAAVELRALLSPPLKELK